MLSQGFDKADFPRRQFYYSEEHYLAKCEAVQSGMNLRAFWINMLSLQVSTKKRNFQKSMLRHIAEVGSSHSLPSVTKYSAVFAVTLFMMLEAPGTRAVLI